VTSLAERVSETRNCYLRDAAGMPSVDPGLALPPDLETFYASCGGAHLFTGLPFEIQISSPIEFVSSNPVIVGRRIFDDISDSWYIVAHGGAGEFLSIDLHPDRLGICYDSFHEVHGVPGSCAVVARSFTDLVDRLLRAHGGHWYWLDRDFVSLGDAYDTVR
jgi:antitoxin YokJ